MGFFREVYEDFCKDEDINRFLLMGTSLFLIIISIALLVYRVSKGIIVLPDVALYLIVVGGILLFLFISMTCCSICASCKDVRDGRNAEARYEEIESAIPEDSDEKECTCPQPDESENQPLVMTSSSEVVIHQGVDEGS